MFEALEGMTAVAEGLLELMGIADEVRAKCSPDGSIFLDNKEFADCERALLQRVDEVDISRFYGTMAAFVGFPALLIALFHPCLLFFFLFFLLRIAGTTRFQYTGMVEKVCKVLLITMAGYDVGYHTFKNKLAQTATTALTATRLMLDDEVRAERTARAFRSRDPNFVR